MTARLMEIMFIAIDLQGLADTQLSCFEKKAWKKKSLIR